MPTSPVFTYTATGVGKETTLGVAVAPTLWVSARDITMTGTNTWLERQAARQQVGREEAETGPFMGAGSFTVETDPDVIGPILAWGMGTESVAVNPTTGNPAAGANVNTTLTTAIAAGVTTFSVALATNIAAGVKLLLDPNNTSLDEAVTVSSITGTTVTISAPTIYPHAANAPVTAITAYDHTLTLGTPRPTFTAQFNRRTDVVSFAGNKVSQMDVTLTPRDLVTVRFGTVYVTEGTATPGTPAFSPQKPYRVIDPGNTLLVNGAASPAGVLSASMSIATGLTASEFTLANGRLMNNIPEGAARVTATLTVQFTSAAFMQLFWGSLGATSPQSSVNGISLAFTILSPSFVNAVVPYKMQVILNNCKISTAPTPGRTGSSLQQTLNIEAYQSAPGAQDDIKFIVTSASAVAA